MRQNERESIDNGTRQDRRRFLKTTSATAGMAFAGSTLPLFAKQSTGANGRIGVGFIGTGARSRSRFVGRPRTR